MKKPWWVRLAGWFFWLGLAWMVMLLWAGSHHVQGAAGVFLLGMPFFAAFVLVCLLVWVAGSLVAWAVLKQGRQQAAILRDVLNERFPSSAVENVPKPAAGSPGKHSSLTCQVCKTRIAALFCTAHGVPVCVADLDTHDAPQCVYVPSARVQVVAAPATQSEREAVTSVLGLR